MKRLTLVLASAALAGSAVPASAILITWNVALGDYSVPGNWVGGVPGAADQAEVRNGGTAQITALGGPFSVTELWAGNNNGAGTIAQSGNTVTSGWVVVGRNGGGSSASGIYNMTGGTLNAAYTVAGQRLLIGDGSGNNGSMTVTGIGTVVNVGNAGVINNELWVSNGPNNTGSLTVSAGAVVNVSSWAAIGRDDSTATGVLAGRNTGTLTINGGTVNKLANGGNFIVGSLNGTGIVNHSAGTLNVATGAQLLMGEYRSGAFGQGGGSATYNLSGTGTVTAPILWAGFLGSPAAPTTSTFAMTGGTLTIGSGGESRIGGAGVPSTTNTSASAAGHFSISGSSVATFANNLQIGAYALGTWTQTGGSATIQGWTALGRYVGSSTIGGTPIPFRGDGTLNISAGTFTQVNAANGLLVGEDGTGVLTISGTGAVDVGGGFIIGNTAAANGTVNLNGGSLAVRFMTKPAAAAVGQVNFNGGTVIAKENQADFFQANLGSANIAVQAGGLKFNTNSFAVGIQEALNGIGGLQKLGAGTLTLSAANGYLGNTTVTNGTLALSATGLISTSPLITVQTGATYDVSAVPGYALALNQTIAGNGSVLGAVVTTVTSKISPGESIGALNFAGALDITGAAGGVSAFAFELAAPGASDVVNVAGAFNIGTGVLDFNDFNFTLSGGFTGGTYTLFNGGSTLTGTLGALNSGTISGLPASISVVGNDVLLSVVPEPGSAGLLALAAALVLRRRRR